MAFFIVFEGLDGSGKSTLIRGLEQELNARGKRLKLTREPGGTPLAEDIRKLLLRTDAEVPVPATELLLYAASRAQHVAGVIQPALKKGEWVICDRFSASSVAFQSYARGVDRGTVDWLNTKAPAKKPTEWKVKNVSFTKPCGVAISNKHKSRRVVGLFSTALTRPKT